MSRYSSYTNPLFQYGQYELEEDIDNEFNDSDNEFINSIMQSFSGEQNVTFTNDDLILMEDILNNPNRYTIDDFNYVNDNAQNLNIYQDEMGTYHVELLQSANFRETLIEEDLEDFEDELNDIMYVDDEVILDDNIDYDQEPYYSEDEL